MPATTNKFKCKTRPRSSSAAHATTTSAAYRCSGWDPTVTTGPASVLTALLGAAPFACVVYPAGNNAGQGTSHTFNALLTSYKESSKTPDKVNFSATLLVTGVDTIAQL